MKLKKKIWGCLVGAAYGDAMGAPTENRTTKQIENLFGSYVDTFLDAPNDVFARGNKAGQITDDFSMAYITCNEIIRNNGVINNDVAINSLLKWSENEKYFEQFVGPTSRAGINALRSGNKVAQSIFVNDNLRGSNGAAMKAGPIALFGNGNFDKTMDIITTISHPTHFNNKSLGGACAIASAICECLNDNATLDSVYDATLKGAEYGEKRGQQLAGPSVLKRIKLAVSLAANSSSMEELTKEIADIVGNGPGAYESVPAAIGLLMRTQDSPLEAIHAAVNIGNDTDTIATMVGAIIGTLYGIEIFSIEDIKLIDDANGYDLELLADEIINIIEGEGV